MASRPTGNTSARRAASLILNVEAPNGAAVSPSASTTGSSSSSFTSPAAALSTKSPLGRERKELKAASPSGKPPLSLEVDMYLDDTNSKTNGKEKNSPGTGRRAMGSLQISETPASPRVAPVFGRRASPSVSPNMAASSNKTSIFDLDQELSDS